MPRIDPNGGVVMFGSGSTRLQDPFGGAMSSPAQFAYRYRPNGTADWSTLYLPPPSTHSLVSLEDAVFDSRGNSFVAGTLYFPTAGGAPDFDIIVRKLDGEGRQLWEDRFAGGGPGTLDTARAVIPDGSGGIFVAGSSQVDPSGGGLQALTTIRYDSQGNRLWAVHHHDPAAHEEAVALVPDGQGGAYVVGKRFPTDGGGTVAVHYDANGSVLWEVRPEAATGYGDRTPAAAAAAADRSGALYVCVNDLDSLGSYTSLKYDSQGRLLWRIEERVEGGQTSAFGAAIDRGRELVVGATLHTGLSGYSVKRISVNGRDRGRALYTGRKREVLFASDMGVDREGNVYVTGVSFPRDGGNRKHATIKLDEFNNLLWRYDYGGPRRDIPALPRISVGKGQQAAVSGLTTLTTVDSNQRPIVVTAPTVYLLK